MRQWISIADEPICAAAVKQYVARLRACGVPVALDSEVQADPDWTADRGLWLRWDGDRAPRKYNEDDLPDEQSRLDDEEDDATVPACMIRIYGRTIRWLAGQPAAAEWWLMKSQAIIAK